MCMLACKQPHVHTQCYSHLHSLATLQLHCIYSTSGLGAITVQVDDPTWIQQTANVARLPDGQFKPWLSVFQQLIYPGD